MALAGAHYEVKGEATVDVMPDLAKLTIMLRGNAADVAGAVKHFNAIKDDVVAKLKNAGVRDVDFTFYGDPSRSFPIHSPTGETTYGVGQSVHVSVRDFSLLPKLTQIVTESGNPDWFVFYDFGDETKPVKLADAAALADATLKAKQYAKKYGLTGTRLVDSKHVRTCFLGLKAYLPSNCETVGEKPGVEEIVVTARKREGPRTDFSVPVPTPRTFTATVDATFELE